MTSHRIADPVFVDRTGRRRRLFTLTGTAGGLLLAAAVLTLLAGFTGTGPATLPGWGDTPTSSGPSRRAVATPAPAPRTPSDRPSAQPATGPAPSVSAAPDPSAASGPSATPTATPTPTVSGKGKDQRRVPTHAPSARPSRRN